MQSHKTVQGKLILIWSWAAFSLFLRPTFAPACAHTYLIETLYSFAILLTSFHLHYSHFQSISFPPPFQQKQTKLFTVAELSNGEKYKTQ